MDATSILVGAAIGFAGSTFGAVIVDNLALRRQTRAQIARDVMADLWEGLRQIEVPDDAPGPEFERAIGALRGLAPLLSAREQRPILVMAAAYEAWLHFIRATDPDPTFDLDQLESDLADAVEDFDRLIMRRSAAPWTLTRWRGWRPPAMPRSLDRNVREK